MQKPITPGRADLAGGSGWLYRGGPVHVIERPASSGLQLAGKLARTLLVPGPTRPASIGERLANSGQSQTSCLFRSKKPSLSEPVGYQVKRRAAVADGNDVDIAVVLPFVLLASFVAAVGAEAQGARPDCRHLLAADQRALGTSRGSLRDAMRAVGTGCSDCQLRMLCSGHPRPERDLGRQQRAGANHRQWRGFTYAVSGTRGGRRLFGVGLVVAFILIVARLVAAAILPRQAPSDEHDHVALVRQHDARRSDRNGKPRVACSRIV
jgi:hypothetical protein